LSGELMHGGRLRQAARHYAIPIEQWLDLSTGINPYGWPVPALAPECWRRLPEEDDGLEEAAVAYYGSHTLLPVAGSQAAIQMLPTLRQRSHVALLSPAYAEHRRAWQEAGHRVSELTSAQIAEQIDQFDVVVVINPNNPSGEHFNSRQLLDWHRRLAARGGWLVIDEAFIDATPEQSMASFTGSEGLLVLRSLGKFFGLAGVRVGFVLAWPSLLKQLRVRLGPWSVSGPAREAARQALRDEVWQRQTRSLLHHGSERLAALLRRNALHPVGSTALFQWVRKADALLWHEALAQRAVLTRPFLEPRALRFGLPGSEREWQRLEVALCDCSLELSVISEVE